MLKDISDHKKAYSPVTCRHIVPLGNKKSHQNPVAKIRVDIHTMENTKKN